jgi:hypothetical protein
MNTISNQVATNKSEQDVINANHKTVQAGEQSRISKQIATDNQEDEKKIAAAVAAQAITQTAIDNTQDITITSMAAKNNTQDENITKLDLPVGTIMAYAPKGSLGDVNSKGSIRWNLWEKGWAVCDQNASKDTVKYNNEYIPDLTDRFLKGHDFTPADISKETAINMRIGQSDDAATHIGTSPNIYGKIKMAVKQMPKHAHGTPHRVTGRGGHDSSGGWGETNRRAYHSSNKYYFSGGNGKTGDGNPTNIEDIDDDKEKIMDWDEASKTWKYKDQSKKNDDWTNRKGAAIDIRPPFYKVVYIMKFKSVLG